MENLQSLLSEGVPLIASETPSDEQRDELLGLRYFKNALENYAENPRLLEDFFRLAGTAARAREDIHRAQVPVHVMVGSHTCSCLLRWAPDW